MILLPGFFPRDSPINALRRAFLSQAEDGAQLRSRVVGLHLVQFIKVFQTDAILLGNGVHGFSATQHMYDVVLGCLAVFLFQVKDVALLQGISLVEVVVLAKLALADVELLGDGLPAIACPHHNV